MKVTKCNFAMTEFEWPMPMILRNLHSRHCRLQEHLSDCSGIYQNISRKLHHMQWGCLGDLLQLWKNLFFIFFVNIFIYMTYFTGIDDLGMPSKRNKWKYGWLSMDPSLSPTLMTFYILNIFSEPKLLACQPFPPNLIKYFTK